MSKVSNLENYPLVSVVVTTKNEEKHIENCLKSIKSQTYPNIEIIVVDNNSTDRTKEIAKKYTNLVFNKGPERSAQRNFGMMKIAKGKYVMYVDADMILSPQLIENCVYEMENDGELLGIYIQEVILGYSFWSKIRRFERSFYNGTPIDSVRMLRKDIFLAVNGFDLSLTGPEDWDLDKKLRQLGKVKLICNRQIKDYQINEWELYSFIRERGVDPLQYSSVIYHNEVEFNLRNYLKKKTYYAKSFDIYIKKWGNKDKDIKKQFGIWYRFVGVFIENGKWKMLVTNPVKAIGMYFLRSLVGFQYLLKSIRRPIIY